MTEHRQPTEEQPAEEEVFEYFLGRVAPDSARRISAWLKNNPLKERELREWAALEKRFGDFPLRSPKEDVLARVRAEARRHVAVESAWGDFFAPIKSLLETNRRALALSFVFVLLVGLNFALRDFSAQQARQVQTAKIPAPAASPALLANRSDAGKGDAVPALAQPSADPEVAAALRDDFNAALALYQQGRYQEVHEKFSAIMARDSRFEKRKELYTYWVETLKQLGKYQLAEKKQKLLEEF